MSIIDHPLDPVKVGSEHPEPLIAKHSFFCYNILTSRKCNSINSGCINKIPLNPPLQKGEAVEMLRLIEMLLGNCTTY